MAAKQTLRARVSGPADLHLLEDADLPVGAVVRLTVEPEVDDLADRLAAFRASAGSWSDVPESLIDEIYAARRLRTRSDADL